MATVDGLTLNTAIQQLSSLLVGGKVDKITQPERDELHIIIRNGGKNHRLLISAAPDSCRASLTQEKKPSPLSAPMFCMLLRKHLTSGRVVAVEQPQTDRIAKFTIESTDELYNTERFYLVCELMGRCSNIILLNSEDIILGAIRHTGISESQARIIMPNIKYALPPTDIKADPLTATVQDIESVLSNSGKIERLLSNAFYGVAPVVVSHILEKWGITASHTEQLTKAEVEKLSQGVLRVFTSIKNGEYKLCLVRMGEKEAFLPFEPADCYEYKTFDNADQLFDYYFAERDRREYMRRRYASLYHAVDIKLKRAEKKLAGFDEAIAGEGDFEKYRIYGELIQANLYRIKQGESQAVLENYYDDPPSKITIPLDEALSPIKNAQKYFKLYKKARGARETAERMREGTLLEIEYLTGVQDAISRADCIESLDEIRQELIDGHYIRQEQKQKQRKAVKAKPERFVSTDGYEILVGRNNYQNDELTFRIAGPFDTWLHVKDRPGSHTVIINKERDHIPDSTLLEAATLAAEHSSASRGVKVEVDYTLCRYVKKPAGALPGKVIYTNQKTIMVIGREIK